MLRWRRGHSFELGEKANARVEQLAAIHNKANLQLGEEANNNELGESNTQVIVPVGAAATANGETNIMDQVDCFSDFEMGNGLGAAVQSCAKGLAEERTWFR